MIAPLLVALAIILPPVPGEYNRNVTQRTLRSTVCVPGYSARVRPSSTWSARYKLMLLHGRPGYLYQLDHLVSLSIGGAPYSRRNLWVQPIRQAKDDDVLESLWHRQLCRGDLTLRQARRAELRWKRVHG